MATRSRLVERLRQRPRTVASMALGVFLVLLVIAYGARVDNQMRVAPGPPSAMRQPIPSGLPVAAAPPILTGQACTSAAGGSSQGLLWPILEPLWGVFAPGTARAQGVQWETAKSDGDVHIATLSGFRYDFQGVGEFVALKSETLQIEVRQQPFGSSRTVSVATSLAVMTGGDVIAIYAGQQAPLRVNHAPAALTEAGLRLAQGAEIHQQGNGVVIVSPGLFELRVLYGGYIDYILTLCDAERGPRMGLLGAVGTDPGAGLATRNGASVQLGGLSRADYARTLYHSFGDSWRIAQEESLFDYPPGQSTATFTDRDFPYESEPTGALSDRQRQEAEATCRESGIIDPAALAECIVDVGATGDPAFAANKALFEAIYAVSRRAPASIATWHCQGVEASPGWECGVHNLTVARIGSTMTLSVETLQAGRKQLETLTCGPITPSFDAPCAGKTQGVQFEGARVIERMTLRTGETWEIRDGERCESQKTAGDPC